MAELVGEDRHYFLCLAFLDQGVVDDDLFLPWQAVEVGVAVGTPFATINNVQSAQWEVEPLCKCFDPGLEVPSFQRGQLVEQGQDEDRVDSDGEHLDHDAEQPEIVEELRPGDLDDLEKGADEGCSQADHQSLPLKHVRYP